MATLKSKERHSVNSIMSFVKMFTINTKYQHIKKCVVNFDMLFERTGSVKTFVKFFHLKENSHDL